MAYVGRAFQIFGLVLLPAALLYGMTSEDRSAIQTEIACIAAGGLAFVVGTFLIRKGQGGGG